MKKNIKVKTEHPVLGEDGTPLYIDILTDNDFDKTTQVQRQLNFRAYYEMIRTINNSGNIHIFSLTYNDENLPYIFQNIYWKNKDKNEFEIEQKKINTAWKPDIQKFNYRLRNYLTNKEYRYKYIITHEYGKEDWYRDDKGKWRKGTARPHYHCIYFVVPSIDENTFNEILWKVWKKGRIRDDILKGNIIAGINYTTKYNTKDTKLKDKRFRPKKEGYEIKDIFYSIQPNIYKNNNRKEFDKIKEKTSIKDDLYMPRLLISTAVGTSYISNDMTFDSKYKEEPLKDKFLKKEHLLPTTVKEREIKTIKTNLPRYYFNKYCKKQIKDTTGEQETITIETEFYKEFKEELKTITTDKQYKQFIKDIHKYATEEEKERIKTIPEFKIKYYLRNKKCNFGTKENPTNIHEIDSEFEELQTVYEKIWKENEKSRINRMETRRQETIRRRNNKAARKLQGNAWKLAK